MPPTDSRALEAAQHCKVPAGWKLVPIEPTPEMVAAMAVIEASSHQVTTFDDGDVEVTELIGMSGAVEAYEAMLAAADPYPKGEVVGPCVCGSWPGGECLRCAQLLSAAPQSDGWISVKDRLPTHNYSVLGVVVDGPLVVAGDPNDRLLDVVSYEPSRGWLQFTGDDASGNDAVVTVTHWQEMDALP